MWSRVLGLDVEERLTRPRNRYRTWLCKQSSSLAVDVQQVYG